MTSDTALHQSPEPSHEPPAAVVSFLDGNDLDQKIGTAIGVVTTDADGWPHPAQLSPGEILLAADGHVSFALHAHSALAENLRRDGRVVLLVAADGANNEMRFEVAEGSPLTDPPLATFSGRMVVNRSHRVPYAEVVSGVQYTLRDPEATLDRWHRQLEGLRGLPG